MITNLEGGDTNISLSSLDRLADALGVDFVGIVADPDASSRRIEQVAWRGQDATSEAVLLGSVPALREAQLWRWSLAPGERYIAEPDPAGWHEMITVTESSLRVETAEGSLSDRSGGLRDLQQRAGLCLHQRRRRTCSLHPQRRKLIAIGI